MNTAPKQKGQLSEAVLFADSSWNVPRSFIAVRDEGALGFLLRWLEPDIPDGHRSRYAYWVPAEKLRAFATSLGIDADDPIRGLAATWSGEERAIELRRRLRRTKYVWYDRAEEARERSDAAIEALDPRTRNQRRPTATVRKAILREELERALGDGSREYLQNLRVALVAAVSRVTETPRKDVTQELCDTTYPGMDIDELCYPNEDMKLIRYAGGRPESVSYNNGRAALDAHTFGDTDYWVTEGNFTAGRAPATTPMRVVVVKNYISSNDGATPGSYELVGLPKHAIAEIADWVEGSWGDVD